MWRIRCPHRTPKVVLGMAPVLGVFGLFCALFLIDLL
jgi:hypothetical protein